MSFFMENKNYNPLRGYLDCEFLDYKINYPCGKYWAEMVRNKSYSYPSIVLEKYHYNA